MPSSSSSLHHLRKRSPQFLTPPITLLPEPIPLVPAPVPFGFPVGPVPLGGPVGAGGAGGVSFKMIKVLG